MQISNSPSGLKTGPKPNLDRAAMAVSVGAQVAAPLELFDIPKKPIAQTIRTLTVGETVEFPCEQRTSVLITANRIKKEFARYGWDYEFTDDAENFVVKILRVR